MKPMIDCIQNYQRKWLEHMNRMITGRIPKTNFTLLANEVVRGEEYETVYRPLGLILDRRRKRK
jgi:hypothetical protein